MISAWATEDEEHNVYMDKIVSNGELVLVRKIEYNTLDDGTETGTVDFSLYYKNELTVAELEKFKAKDDHDVVEITSEDMFDTLEGLMEKKELDLKDRKKEEEGEQGKGEVN